MILIWKGYGFFVAVVTVASLVITTMIAEATAGKGYVDHHRWPLGVSLLTSGLICWFVGDRLRKSPGRVVIDKRTGREFTLRKTHSLFFIPVHWWGAILGAGSLILFASGLARQ